MHGLLAERGITVSAGVATWPDDADEREALMAGADAALYWAKRNGKNICAAVPIRSVSGFPACPMALKAKPHSSETKSTCSTLPSANAPMKVLGMMPSRNCAVVR